MGKVRRGNGEGFCYKIDNNPNRKKPWKYGFTIGWTDEGKPIRKVLGYATSEAKGNKELNKYLVTDNQDETPDFTWKELYTKWRDYKMNTGISKAGLQHYENAYKKTLILENKKFSEITLEIMQNIINISGVKTDGQKRIRNLYSQLYEYAKILNSKVGNDFSKFLIVEKQEKSGKHVPFTKDEIIKLWSNRNNFIDIILFMIYTGIRPNELFKINEYYDDYFVTGSKTEAGMNRKIPVHNDIKDIYKNIRDSIEEINKNSFYSIFKNELSRLNINHYPYDTRHTFATAWKLSKADDLVRKKIMGHSEKDITNKVYTHLDLEFMQKELNKVVFM